MSAKVPTNSATHCLASEAFMAGYLACGGAGAGAGAGAGGVVGDGGGFAVAGGGVAEGGVPGAGWGLMLICTGELAEGPALVAPGLTVLVKLMVRLKLVFTAGRLVCMVIWTGRLVGAAGGGGGGRRLANSGFRFTNSSWRSPASA